MLDNSYGQIRMRIKSEVQFYPEKETDQCIF